MNTQQKTTIITAANNYIAVHGLSQNELARKASINQGYLSVMLKGIFETTVNEKVVPIGDKWFAALAATIGFSFHKTYWETIPTIQFAEIIDTLDTCKQTGKTALLIGSTGCGKTYATDVFVNKNPNHTYRITVSSLYKLVDIMNELTDLLGLDVGRISTRIQAYSMKLRMDAIVARLVDIKRSGGNPIIIFDEGENMEMGVLKMIKGLYDGIKDNCSIVIIGTEQLINKLLNLRKRNREAIPQLYRRFKAGQKILTPVGRDFKPFLDKYVSDKGLRKLLTDLCDNYGELNDYLQPALKACEEIGIEISEDFFRIMYDLPKYR